MSGEILFLAHRLPFPPDRGDKIRSHHILKALAQIAPVHVGCLAETDADVANEGMLSEVATSWCMPRRTKSLPLAGIESLLRREPVSLSAFRSSALSHWVGEVLRQRDIRAIYVFSGQMGQYVPASWKGRLVVDLVDVDSAKFEAYGVAGKGPRSWIDWREGRLLSRVEADLVSRADTTLLVSEAEAEFLRSRTPGGHDIRSLGNGIDCAAFDPAAVAPEPSLKSDGPHFVFTGQMDYAPNIAAVTRMAQQIMSLVQQTLPSAQFHIVGRAPTKEVLALHGANGTHVVGEVSDTRPWLAGADAVVAPLTIARGVQNKVLEAMAMARPVVVSPDAATGIDARPDQHFIITQDDADFAAALLRLWQQKDQARSMGEEARRFVLNNMSWPATLADLSNMLGIAPRTQRDAA
ncbi:TIGR03087 family PEP-CTERM/XrtA system glycosyltransferase [Aurantiacibacter rhizosphaerae]|uniref:TIGR03087 family PEP-CTERM/XrtA system glycosyltransferase n=1 Tax=Aurantiacibacter rhizosphaerae TaxID=2691582 RepID=A0A844XDP7_9SPHN|nr:TIGR03087 family PEP-CTERM/XrtA system glycosyltransferase [Aurantiacibacter rhizosphaerae]